MRPTAGVGVEVSTLASAKTGTEYSLYVSLPDSYAGGSSTYPLLLLLDADSYFTETCARARALAAEGSMEEAVIVGIGYGAGEDMRNRDYTPTAVSGVSTDSGAASGGAAAFLAFITDELLPWAGTNYRVSTDRAARGILGHSYGGLFVFYALFNASDSLGAFIASSPSLGWDSLVSFSYVDAWASSGRSKSVSLFASTGAGDGFPVDALVSEMAARVQTVCGMAPTVRYYPNTVHADAWESAFPDGMAVLFTDRSGQ